MSILIGILDLISSLMFLYIAYWLCKNSRKWKIGIDKWIDSLD
ncbi:hypothetical protein LCGC14_0346090 [marine sediment metagenome]|uniref:Uncharacterized protein n=1 Tax=marine sediment metagenome TaxID=412755 RepID=A0A0F9TV69_9ZZZZ